MFTGKVCVITGAANGIGRELVQQLLNKGAIIYGIDTDELNLNRVAAESAKLSRDFYSCVSDVTSETEMAKVRETILSRHPGIDFWFNNAGIAGTGDFLTTPHATFRRVISVNLDGVVLGTRIALETMEQKGAGTIINMASVAGHLAAPFLSAYSASKHAVVGFTRALREELSLKDSSVQLIMVSPGFVETQMVNKGKTFGFPDWLSFLLATPEQTVKEILRGIEKGKSEIYPTLNGKALMKLRTFFPKTTAKSSRVLLAKRFRDLFLNRYSP